MRDFNKFGPFGCGRVKAALGFSLSVSGVALMLGVMGGGMLFVCGEAQAAVCFLPDCVEKAVGSSDPNGRICRSDGYLPNGEIVCSDFSYVEYCPEDASYIKCNTQKWCEDNGYTVLTEDCTVPEYADEQCPNGLELYKRCQADYERACEEEDEGYVSECQEGWKLDDEELCSYSPLYGKCCNECLDYPYEEDEIPAGYQKGESCDACGGITKYQKELNDCAADGFIRCEKGGQTGTEVCLSGSEKWYKECCSECSDYPYFENEIPEGYVKGDSCDSCDGVKYKTKVGECATDYKWENGACVSACDNTCSVGNILYSDHTCSSCKVSGKTPIGVVSYAEGTKRLAVNLDHTSMQWGGYGTDIPGLTNIRTSYPASYDLDGKSNASKIVSVLGSGTSYAPGYCYNFTTAGTSKGQWYLPAAGELYASVWTNKLAVNSGLSAAGGTKLEDIQHHWSSSEYSDTGAWIVSFYNGGVNLKDKNTSDIYVRCVLPFEDNGGGTAKVCDKEYIYSCSVDSSTHITGGVGDSCAGTYKSCTCESGYEWKDGICEKSCVVGSILNSDMSCSASKVSGKTPIGVVSYVNGSKRIAINLVHTSMAWSSGYTDISGITNYTFNTDAKTDFNGKSNTAAWVSYYGSSVTNYAPGYCYNFTTAGTSKGQWYLPAAGEAYASVWTNKTAVNTGLSAAGGTSIQDGYHWSSSEGDIRWVWFVNASNANVANGVKDINNYARCVLEF